MVLKGQALRDAEYVLSFGVGSEWHDGAKSGFRLNRLDELKAAGVLLPHPSKENMLVVGRGLPNDGQLPPLTGATGNLLSIAEGDRDTFLRKLDAHVIKKAGDVPADLLAQLLALYREVALRQTDYRWWMKHLSDHEAGRTVRGLFTPDDFARQQALAAQRHTAPGTPA